MFNDNILECKLEAFWKLSFPFYNLFQEFFHLYDLVEQIWAN